MPESEGKRKRMGLRVRERVVMRVGVRVRMRSVLCMRPVRHSMHACMHAQEEMHTHPSLKRKIRRGCTEERRT